MGRTEHSPGVAYQFERGELEALSSDVERYLRSRPSYGVQFWEAGEDPAAPADSSAIMAKILDAVIDLDDPALKQIYDAEMASHRRTDVLQAALHGRRQVRGRTGDTQGDE